MSQKIHPFHLRSQRADPKGSSLQGTIGTHGTAGSLWSEISYSEPRKRKWGSNYYSRTLHENKLISEYCQGLFRTFGCYLKSCTVERSQQSSYQTIHITNHVLRTPVSRVYDTVLDVTNGDPSNSISMSPKVPMTGTYSNQRSSYRSPKEKFLEQGLREQWLPWILLQQIGTFLSTAQEVPAVGTCGTVRKDLDSHPQRGKTSLESVTLESPISKEASDLLPLINSKTGDWNDQLHEHTELSRLNTFFSRWNQWIKEGVNDGVSSLEGVSYGTPSNSGDNEWWKTRSWTARWKYTADSTVPMGYPLWGQVSTADTAPTVGTYGTLYGTKPLKDSIVEETISGYLSGTYDIPGFNHQRWGSTSGGRHVQLTFTIKPVSSLVMSPQLVADYMADKIEQSLPLQSIYQDIHQYFSTYELNRSADPTVGTYGTDPKVAPSDTSYSDLEIPPKILGYRLSCSGRLQKTKFSKPAEMAESVVFQEGVLPLNSISKNIQYGSTSATNAYGSCGIKVWIHYA